MCLLMAFFSSGGPSNLFRALRCDLAICTRPIYNKCPLRFCIQPAPSCRSRNSFIRGIKGSRMLNLLVIHYISVSNVWIPYRHCSTVVVGLPTFWKSWSDFPSSRFLFHCITALQYDSERAWKEFCFSRGYPEWEDPLNASLPSVQAAQSNKG
ncbi:hypothetical protein BDP27DRAFT_1328116 [Rhodocollybia butyracea]|uniref:Uncharacterized protein n=1 Tax=Rhodocollybia butyracea TaxID=206335 RepID=A0A9P5PQX5_9AGAR|nr:hypothetical protein BDP27DRAFT_1328116 [Rhodocollybia butyracea]